ncbi:MAG TPA: hypothetical protein VJP77_08210, partial [Planctomycetota bacterium]|nr:hypothetical protein [Planctomycetota bacterium]
AALAALCALAPGLFAQAHWTVDDDGPADFADVAAAVAAVGAGDVLLVQPGNYGPVTLTKRLALLGDPSGERPHLAALTVDGAASFELAHFAVGATVVRDVPGPSRIDDCELLGVVQHTGLIVDGAFGLIVQRTRVAPPELVPTGASAVFVGGTSVVAIVDSLLEGGDAGADFANGLEGLGGHGLWVDEQAYVVLSGSSARGGDGDDLTGFAPGVVAGEGGDGVQAWGGSVIDVRGSSDDELRGGDRIHWQFGPQLDGKALVAFGAGATYSGVTLVGGTSTSFPPLAAPAPHLYVRGTSFLGGQQRVSFFGPAGATGVVGLSLGQTFTAVPGFEGFLWLSPGALLQVVPLVLAGQETPANHVWDLPGDASLAGLAALVQGVVVDPLGLLVPTNPAAIVLGF